LSPQPFLVTPQWGPLRRLLRVFWINNNVPLAEYGPIEVGLNMITDMSHMFEGEAVFNTQ
jgi:hypothetical protein